MASATVQQLRGKADAAWANLERQLHGMDPHMERADAPGQWTTREVLSHLCYGPDSNPVDFLATFAEREYPVVDLRPGEVSVTPERRAMSLRQFRDVLVGQLRDVFAYLEKLPEADLERRKVRIPAFKQFVGTEEISLAMFVSGMFEYHWNDHAGQLAKIRLAAGLPEAR